MPHTRTEQQLHAKTHTQRPHTYAQRVANTNSAHAELARWPASGLSQALALFDRHWKAEVSSKGFERASFVRCLLRTYRWPFARALLLVTLSTGFAVVGPVFFLRQVRRPSCSSVAFLICQRRNATLSLSLCMPPSLRYAAVPALAGLSALYLWTRPTAYMLPSPRPPHRPSTRFSSLGVCLL